MTLWILALMGIAINFLGKYNSRKVKDDFDPIFWVKDNWPEAAQSLLWVAALMIMIMSEEAVIEFDQLYNNLLFPATIQLPAKMLTSFLIGLGCSEAVYWMNKKKIQWTKKNE